MKAAHNGVPSLSVLDGWRATSRARPVWSIGPASDGTEPATGDRDDGADLYAKLEVILPLFHRDRAGWIRVMRHSIALNASYFNTHRMVLQYVVNAYL